MTDDLSIKQRPSALPYLAVGGALGAGAGYVVNDKFITKPMSHSDIIAEVNSKDKFEARVKDGAEHATSWQEVKTKADEVAELDKKLAEAKNGVPTDKDIVKNLEDAQRAYDKNLQTLKEQQEGILRNSNGRPTTTPIEFDRLNTSGTAAERTRLQNEYNRLRTAYEAANTRVEATINAGAGATRSTRLGQIQTYLNTEFTNFGTQTEEQIVEAFNQKTRTRGWGIRKREVPTPQYERAYNQAAVHYPDFTRADLTGEQYLQFGQQMERGATRPSGYTSRHVTITDPVTHRPKRIGVMYKEADLVNFVKTESERIAEQRIAYADELFNNARESVLLRQRQAALPREFANSVEKGLANSTGLYIAATATTPEAFNFAQIQREAAGTFSVPSRRGTTTLTGYDADISRLNEAKRAAGRTGTPTMPTGLNGAYATTDVQKALDQAKARKAVFEKYNKEANALAREIEQCATSNSVIANLDSQIANIRANDAGLAKARANFVEKFPEVFGKTGEAATLSEAEILAKAEQYAKEHADKGLQKRLEQAKAAYENAAKEVDKTLVKELEGKHSAAKGELEKLTESLGKKYTKGGNKWLAIGVGAAALGLGALMLRPKNN